ncbi:MAG: hypothetical protein PHE87_09990 [Victivallaceae bacterium]|nr:hypothetical protein [Victivallaceae bacterium]
MGSGAPDSMWIREINTIKAERDKAIADREKISRILYEREEVGQRQIDELLRRLEYEKEDKKTNEFPIRARWVKLSEREPDRDKEVFARNTKDGMISTIKFWEDGPCRYIIGGKSFMLDDDEVYELPEWEWLELEAQQCGEVFTEVVPARDWTREAFATMLIMQIVTMVLIFLNLEGGW